MTVGRGTADAGGLGHVEQQTMAGGEPQQAETIFGRPFPLLAGPTIPSSRSLVTGSGSRWNISTVDTSWTSAIPRRSPAC